MRKHDHDRDLECGLSYQDDGMCRCMLSLGTFRISFSFRGLADQSKEQKVSEVDCSMNKHE
jgi:hypothetical protein